MSKIVIFGTGSIPEVAHFYLSKDSEHQVVAFTVEENYIKGGQLLGLPVVAFENIENSHPPDEYKMFVAIGYSGLNRLRAEKYQAAKAKGYQLITYVSSKCTHWGDTEIGDNCFILEDNTLQPFVSIGDNVTLWSGNHIGHHVSIGDHTFMASHVVVSGHTRIGRYCFVGVNSTFRDSIEVGDNCIVGAGALIMRSVEDGGVYSPSPTPLHAKPSTEIWPWPLKKD